MKLTVIIHYDCWKRYLFQKKGLPNEYQQSFFTFLQHVKRSARRKWLCLFFVSRFRIYLNVDG
jgi:hypothetical protein